MVNSKYDWEWIRNRLNVVGSIPDEQDILDAPRHKHRHPCLPRKGWRVMFTNGEEWNIARVLGVCENENREARGQIYIEIGNGKTWRFAFWDNVYCFEYQDLIEQIENNKRD